MPIKLLQNCGVYKNEIFALLNQLTSAPEINIRDYTNMMVTLKNQFHHNIFVYIVDDKPVGMVTLLVEQKLIHGGKCVGHIEDLVVDKDHRNQGIAKKLLEHAIQIAGHNNCYKVILDSDKELVPFYERRGFKQKEIQMRLDL